MDQTFTVAPATLLANTIAFGAAPTGVTFGEVAGTHSVHATATSGTISYASLTPSVCTVNATTGALTVKGSGPCEIQASETGQAAGYAAASSVDQTFTVLQDSSTTQLTESATNANVGSENLVIFTVTVTSGHGEPVPAGGAVSIYVGTTSCHATTNASGVASCSIAASALPSGIYYSWANFAGETNIAASNATGGPVFDVNLKPAFTSANSTSAAVNHWFSFQVSATGIPAPTYSLSGQPSGVTITPTGVLQGGVAKTGTYTFTITLTSAAGVTNQTFTLTIT